MSDIYTKVTEAAPKILESLMAALELRAADPQQRAMLHTYLTDAALPQEARLLEVGCGTGAVTRVLATWPGVSETIGVDPSPVFVAKARELAEGCRLLLFRKPMAARCRLQMMRSMRCGCLPYYALSRARARSDAARGGAGSPARWMPRHI